MSHDSQPRSLGKLPTTDVALTASRREFQLLLAAALRVIMFRYVWKKREGDKA